MVINIALLAIFGLVRVIAGKLPGSRIFFVEDGFYYHIHTSRENSPFIHLRCNKRHDRNIRCRGRAIISRDGSHYWISQPHSHAPNPLYPMELELRRRIYARLGDGDATLFRNVIRQEGQRYVYS